MSKKIFIGLVGIQAFIALALGITSLLSRR
jgi:hypothetical protein